MNRANQRAALLISLLVAVTGSSARAAAPPEPIANFGRPTKPATVPVAVSSEPQLFIDDYLIAESTDVVKTTHTPTRASDHPILGWAAGTAQPYVTVVRDPQTRRFRMWYNKDIGRSASIAYAESGDGITWQTPTLGILGDDNRLIPISSDAQGGYGVSVIDDGPDAAPPEQRFKVAWWGQDKPWPDGDPGMRVAFSSDGIHWKNFPGNPVLPDFSEKHLLGHPRRAHGAGDIIDVFRDPYRKRYVALVKTPAVASDGLAPGPKASTHVRRLVSASASDDFVRWEQPWRVVVPEARDAGLLEFYSVGGTIARGGVLIGFARMLRDDLPATPGGPAEGIGYATLVTSRDGKHWERHNDVFFDRHPDPNAWDHAMTWIGCVLPVEDELFIYYGGYKQGHKIEPRKERQLGLARMPRDRFVSRDAADGRTGILKTVPLQLSQDDAPRRLVLNADCARGGEIRVQLRDARSGEIVPGFGFDACKPIVGNGHQLPVEWRDAAALPAGGRTELRLEFQLKNAGVYGFQVMPGQQDP